MIMHLGGTACLGNYGWGWHPWWKVLPAVNKVVLHTYARRNCLGTEATEGSCIVRVGVVVLCRKT